MSGTPNASQAEILEKMIRLLKGLEHCCQQLKVLAESREPESVNK